MKKLFFVLLSMTLFLSSPAYSKEDTGTVSLPAGIQEVHAATLEDSGNKGNEKPKLKKKTKSKKSKKVKKTSAN